MIVTKNRIHNKGFTLIELLVVISIIAMLMSIMLPTLRAARGAGQKVYCLSNLRQMAIAASNYTMSSDDYFPLSQWADAKKSYCWDFVTYYENGNPVVEPGLLWQGETIESIHQCPSYKGSSNFGPIDTYTGYNYNTSYIGHGQGESTAPGYSGKVIPHPVWPGSFSIVMPAKATKVMEPQSCALFGDGHYSGGANKFMRSPNTWYGDRSSSIRSAGTQGFRHNQKTNVAWADGHAESVSDCYTDSYDKVYNTPLDQITQTLDNHNETTNVKIGFLSQDNDAYDLR